MITKETARLRTRLTKTPVRAGDLIMRVKTDEVYRLDSWEFFGADNSVLWCVRHGRERQGRKAFRLSDFGLELYVA